MQKRREDWLKHALEVLRNEGIQGVRIEKMAREMGVTKGSFYWHFKDLADLRRSLLEYWSAEFTEVVTRHSRLEETNPEGAVLNLMLMVRERHLDRYELAVRAWAEHDPQAAAQVRQVYRDRVQFVGRLFRRVGFTGKSLDVRTRLLLSYLSWEPSMMLGDSDAKRRRTLRDVHELLMRD